MGYCAFTHSSTTSKRATLSRRLTLTKLIARALKISMGSTRMISKVLNNVTDCFERGLEYDRERQQYYEARETRKLKTGSLDEQLTADWIDGLGFRLTMMLLNSHCQ